jgi:hypothetical protein
MTEEKEVTPLGMVPITGFIVKYAVPSVISTVVGIRRNAATGITFPVALLCSTVIKTEAIKTQRGNKHD